MEDRNVDHRTSESTENKFEVSAELAVAQSTGTAVQVRDNAKQISAPEIREDISSRNVENSKSSPEPECGDAPMESVQKDKVFDLPCDKPGVSSSPTLSPIPNSPSHSHSTAVEKSHKNGWKPRVKYRVKLRNYVPKTQEKRKASKSKRATIPTDLELCSSDKNEADQNAEPVFSKCELVSAMKKSDGREKAKKVVKWLDLTLPDSVNKWIDQNSNNVYDKMRSQGQSLVTSQSLFTSNAKEKFVNKEKKRKVKPKESASFGVKRRKTISQDANSEASIVDQPITGLEKVHHESTESRNSVEKISEQCTATENSTGNKKKTKTSASPFFKTVSNHSLKQVWLCSHQRKRYAKS